MANTIVLYPCTLAGHLGSMVELGKLILARNPTLSVTILTAVLPVGAASTNAYLDHITKTTPITIHHLPTGSIPLDDTIEMEFVDLIFTIPRILNPAVHHILEKISRKSTIKAVILDFFCDAAFQVSTNLGIPTYYFYTSGASLLCSFLYCPTIHRTTTKSFKEMDGYLNFPGLPPVHARDLPEVYQDRTSNAYTYFVNTGAQMARSSGIITNTFQAFEPRAVKTLLEGKCVPDGSTPPIYHIGPLIATGNNCTRNEWNNKSSLKWLDEQPSGSVVFLTFGSMGSFEKEQVKEIGIGLEKSGQRFLWVVRNPPSSGGYSCCGLTDEVDLDSLLPAGFLDRTKDKGLVVKNWAPQVDILSHDSVGGFVTHCGWNSVLESVMAGVPMLAWPLYAEQKLNAVVVVEEVKVALALERSKDGFVTAEVMEKQVRELMAGESGRATRDRVLAMKESAKATIEEGGTSWVSFATLTKPWTTT